MHQIGRSALVFYFACLFVWTLFHPPVVARASSTSSERNTLSSPDASASSATKKKNTIHWNTMNPQQDDVPPNTKVCLIGSGNWGSAIATMVGRNCAALSFCDNAVNMWVFEEEIEVPAHDNSGTTKREKLSHVINQRHENVKYLPGVPLPHNVVAVPDLAVACADATLLIFVLPHQFLPKLLPILRQHVHPACRGVSLIKGLGESNHVKHVVLCR